MIEERYCSPEVSKLLKEKKFDIPVWTRYEDNGEVVFGDKYNWNNNYKSQISAPTQSMVMDWLREVHNIDICVFPYESDYISWDYEARIYKNKEMYLTITGFKIYKESCEAAIKYCLENLI